jgi:hypothetical protein
MKRVRKTDTNQVPKWMLIGRCPFTRRLFAPLLQPLIEVARNLECDRILRLVRLFFSVSLYRFLLNAGARAFSVFQ